MSRMLLVTLLLAAGAAGCSESMAPPTNPTPTVEVATTAPPPAPAPAPVPDPVPPPSAPRSARYEVTFESTWSGSTHPTDFPTNAHYSGLVGGTHSSRVAFWREGDLASEGIRNMAEVGSKSPLTEEVRQAMGLGSAEHVLSGGALGTTPGVIRMEFDLTQDFALVTLVTMVAPSPDWFVGVSGLPLFENGQWTSVRVVPLLPYDAGTDSGSTYRSGDQATTPRQPIRQITGFPMIYNGVVAPFGTFTFRKIE
jgi:hypothetical protein